MTDEMDGKNLAERVSLIESMMAEGRQGTARWGWSFVLWGVAYLVATVWSSGWVGAPVWSERYLAWPVTMIAAGIATGVAIARMKKGQPPTALGRALGATWRAMGICLFIVLMSLGWSGRYDLHVFLAIIGAMLGTANMASAMILKWKMQFACALVWLGSAVLACFGTEEQAGIAFLAATFFCQIVFGVYVMICESRRRRQSGVVHA